MTASLAKSTWESYTRAIEGFLRFRSGWSSWVAWPIESGSVIAYICQARVQGRWPELVLHKRSIAWKDFSFPNRGGFSSVGHNFYLPPDHAAITCNLHIARPEPVKMKMSLHKLHDIDLDSFCTDILNSSLSSSAIIDLLVNEFNNVLPDNDAPLITRTVRCRPNAP